MNANLKCILCVEDEPEMIDLMRLILGRRGFEVKGAAGGVEGLKMIRQEPPDLVLLDLMMPDMDGWELLRRLQADTAATWKAADLTAYYDSSVAQKARQAGFAACLPKPATVQTAAALQSLLLP